MLLLDAEEVIASHICQIAGTTYVPGEAKIGIPYSSADLAPGTGTLANTSVRIRYQGKEYTYSYNRQSLIGTFMQFPYLQRSLLKLQTDPDDIRVAIAKSFVAHYGYPMRPEDIIGDSVVVLDDILVFDISKKSLRYLPEKLQFKLDGKYVRVGNDLARLVEPTRVEPEWWYEDRVDWLKLPDTTPRPAQMTYGVDYTPIAEHLTRFWGEPVWQAAFAHTNLGRLGELAGALRSVDGLPWCGYAQVQSTGLLNLYYMWPVYNGPTALCKRDTGLTTRVPAEQLRMLEHVDTSYTHVLVLRSESGASLMGDKSHSHSCLILHYNLKG